ncbi:MAG: hypothetical protein RQM90_08760 [Methanoculleus sp.]
MVNDAGQLYTMEGIAGWAHHDPDRVHRRQHNEHLHDRGYAYPGYAAEQLGSDVLAMMDTPDNSSGENQLVGLVYHNRSDNFKKEFLRYCNATTDGTLDNLHMSASVTYRKNSVIKEHPFVAPDETWTGRESAVRVTRWVQLTEGPPNPYENRLQAVLVEVLLWRA